MLFIDFEATGFQPSFPPALHGGHRIHVTWADLMRAAIKVGRPSWRYVYRHGSHSRHEASYKRYLLRANLRASSSYSIVKSNVYESLDPSEKSGVSYFLGLTAASLLCERLLGIPWLIHFDVFGNLFPAIDTSGRRRPDLIGSNVNTDFVVVESKGRTNSAGPSVVVDAKQQTQVVNTIGGKNPIARISSVAHFSNDDFSVRFHDPAGDKEGGIELPVEPEEFARSSYDPILSLLSVADDVEITSIAGQDYAVTNIPDTDDRIGLINEIAEATSVFNVATRIVRDIRPVSDGLRSIGRDGMLVELGSGWTREQMVLEPIDRSA